MSSKLNVKPLNEWGFDFKKPVIISGPCSAESEEQLLETAQGLADKGIDILRAGIWKPRTRPGGFEGLGNGIRTKGCVVDPKLEFGSHELGQVDLKVWENWHCLG